MAISWLTVLQNVPWNEVISNAPKVADGAKKLWNTVGKSQGPADARPSSPHPARSPEANAVSELRSQVDVLEEEIEELHGQMLASSGLIKDLAEQNAQLIARMEALRKRVARLTAGAALAGVVAAAALAAALLR